MGSRYHPSIGDQCTAAAEFPSEEPTFDQRHLPGMRAKARGMSSYNAIGSGVDLAAAWE